MNWNKFKKDCEAHDNKGMTGLGVCEVGIGCINGKPYLEICPVVARIKSENGLACLTVEIDAEREVLIADGIMELASNASIINEDENLKKEWEDLLSKFRAKASAIGDLKAGDLED